MKDVLQISLEKKQQLEQELREINDFKMPEIIKQISMARDQGDLSENADYDAAKNEQGNIQRRKEEIENILKTHVVIDKSTVDRSSVSIGTKVEVIGLVDDKTPLIFEIVGPVDVNSFENKISPESPFAKAILDKKVGDEVIYNHNSKSMKIKILRIL